ncbi:hypothetical protein ccbrp13_49800 [Ktedonobacteria bacterium brp13]|nr:hypothetical protein ccbrp13_49800 [Ktedonobacteria bacterium brp13]
MTANVIRKNRLNMGSPLLFGYDVVSSCTLSKKTYLMEENPMFLACKSQHYSGNTMKTHKNKKYSICSRAKTYEQAYTANPYLYILGDYIIMKGIIREL